MAQRFALTLIEHPVTGARYERGDKVPADLPGIDELEDGGAVGDKPKDDEDEGE